MILGTCAVAYLYYIFLYNISLRDTVSVVLSLSTEHDNILCSCFLHKCYFDPKPFVAFCYRKKQV